MDDFIFVSFDDLLDELGSLLRKKGNLRRLLSSEDPCGVFADLYKDYMRVNCRISEIINQLENC